MLAHFWVLCLSVVLLLTCTHPLIKLSNFLFVRALFVVMLSFIAPESIVVVVPQHIRTQPMKHIDFPWPSP